MPCFSICRYLLVARILVVGLVYRENSADPVSIAVVGLVGISLLKGVSASGKGDENQKLIRDCHAF